MNVADMTFGDLLAAVADMKTMIESQQEEIRNLKERSQDDTPEILSTIESARFMHVSPAKVNAWREAGILPALKMGNKWQFRKADLLSLFDAFNGCDLTDRESTMAAIIQKRYVTPTKAERASRQTVQKRT